MTDSSSSRVLWIQVGALALVQGAIALAWVLYNLYLVTLLTQAGLSAALAAVLLVIENVLAAVMEPLMGSLSDRMQAWVGTRFPFVALGVVLTILCFLVLPSVAIAGADNPLMRSLLPVVLVLWALSMAVFRSPALSLLGRYAMGSSLPQAASVLTLVGGVAGAMGPLAGGWISGLGAQTAFGIGSVVLLLAAVTLWRVRPDQSVSASPEGEAQGGPPNFWGALRSLLPSLAFIFGTGAGITFGFRTLMTNFPKILASQVPDTNAKLILGSIFVALALTALPAGRWARKLGNRRAIVAGTVAMAFFCGVTAWAHSAGVAMLLAICLGASFSLVSNGTLPFALSMVPADKGGLGTGIYFSGAAVASSVFGSTMPQAEFAPTMAVWLGAIAFLLSAACVLGSGKIAEPSRPHFRES